MRRWSLLAIAAFSLACAKAKPGDVPALVLGVDVCARCGMIVSEARHAAGYVDAEGRSVIYDDLGEFVAAAREKPGLEDVAYVHDFESGRWLRAREATIERIEGFPTPMGTGTVAFSDRASAESFLSRRRALAETAHQ